VLASPSSTGSFNLIFQLPNLNTTDLCSPNGICRPTLISAATLQRVVPISINSCPLIAKFFPTITNRRRISRCRPGIPPQPQATTAFHSDTGAMGVCLSCLGLSRQSSSDVCHSCRHVSQTLAYGYFPPCSPNALTCSIPTTLTTPLAMATQAQVRD
jgi:hypothetical protein